VSFRDRLAKRASKAGLSFSPELAAGLEAYFVLLQKWNRKVSLTSLPVADAGDEAIDRLLIEPVLAARFLPSPQGKAIDIGSGGGSPAVPLKLAVPGISIRMVESKTRKAAFLREVVRSLELREAEVEAVRFEELLARPTLHETADVVTMRAVKVDGKILAGLQAFLKPGGLLFLFGTGSNVAPKTSPPQLSPTANHVLLKKWGSQLEILQKNSS
jgi:16S rRNA (guanine527-N7)-methyltransferase